MGPSKLAWTYNGHIWRYPRPATLSHNDIEEMKHDTTGRQQPNTQLVLRYSRARLRLVSDLFYHAEPFQEEVLSPSISSGIYPARTQGNLLIDTLSESVLGAISHLPFFYIIITILLIYLLHFGLYLQARKENTAWQRQRKAMYYDELGGQPYPLPNLPFWIHGVSGVLVFKLFIPNHRRFFWSIKILRNLHIKFTRVFHFWLCVPVSDELLSCSCSCLWFGYAFCFSCFVLFWRKRKEKKRKSVTALYWCSRWRVCMWLWMWMWLLCLIPVVVAVVVDSLLLLSCDFLLLSLLPYTHRA